MGPSNTPTSTFSPAGTSAGSISSSANTGGSDILMIILICVFAIAAIIFAIIAISANQKNKKILMQLSSQPINPAYSPVPGYQPAVNVCAKCGALHAPGVAFCPNCGSKL